MPRHLIVRGFALLAGLISGVATCVLAWIAVEDFHQPHESVKAVYRFDLSHSADPQADLDRACLVFSDRLKSFGATRLNTWIAGEREVGFDCLLPVSPDVPGKAEEGPRVDLDPDLRALLEERGDLRLLAKAEAHDLARLGSDLEQERDLVDRWRRDHPGSAIEGLNELPRESGGPVKGLCWYPMRPSKEAPEAEPDLVPLLVAEPKWSFVSEDLETVRPSADSYGYPAVQFEVGTARKDDFGDFTESLIDKQLAIVVSGEVLTLPVVKSRLPGSGIIEGGTGGFTASEVRNLVRTLRSGELPSSPVLVPTTRSPASRSTRWLVPAGLAVIASLMTFALLLAFALTFRAKPPEPSDNWSARGPLSGRG